MSDFISTFDLFKIGVGPSSSHTMGPMTAACRFVRDLKVRDLLPKTTRIVVALYGSLALTGRGHATDTAVMLGLMGLMPAEVDPDAAAAKLTAARAQRQISLLGEHRVSFDETRDIEWHGQERLGYHSNGVTFSAHDADGKVLHRETYYSIGGGFVVSEHEIQTRHLDAAPSKPVPYPFTTGEELLEMCASAAMTIAQLMMRNECALRAESDVLNGLDQIAAAMNACIDRGLHQNGVLPGGLNVRRRAAVLRETLEQRERSNTNDPLIAMDWINAWALAVNEENAAGGRVVTAPTNGAAGVVPAVLRYLQRFCGATQEQVRMFLLTAAAIGGLYKRNASISAAEVGCQGEIGVACSMAAAGLTAAQGGTNEQVENAAEIGMEHNLGLTCDPVRGLVQIPCIERNATGAVKAVDASRLALLGDGVHHVTLDQVIETMRRTGADMRESYKETSLAGLAVNVPEC